MDYEKPEGGWASPSSSPIGQPPRRIKAGDPAAKRELPTLLKGHEAATAGLSAVLTRHCVVPDTEMYNAEEPIWQGSLKARMGMIYSCWDGALLLLIKPVAIFFC